MELSKAELHVEKGETPKHQHCEVGYEEGTFEWFSTIEFWEFTSSIGVADIGEPPNVSKINGKTNLERFPFLFCISTQISTVIWNQSKIFYNYECLRLTTARRNSIFFPQTSLTSVSTTISVLIDFVRKFLPEQKKPRLVEDMTAL